MPTFAELEKEALNLPPEEREMLALAVWESIGGRCSSDSKSLEIARQRDKEIESDAVRAISHQEFMQRTSASGSE